jgi:hypothetical protein
MEYKQKHLTSHIYSKQKTSHDMMPTTIQDMRRNHNPTKPFHVIISTQKYFSMSLEFPFVYTCTCICICLWYASLNNVLAIYKLSIKLPAMLWICIWMHCKVPCHDLVYSSTVPFKPATIIQFLSAKLGM